ncbi:hypothetical protein LX24_00360 [Desulfallas thermosapovorans DSM 6562]|uniref:Uncharacterized protein n=1 Tax=Desulfallas thermosapovorans DSM 6562 TaxID=1121431 RepID=A0A5S4ZWJ7_9FIRM|nr:hypothetical protein LX24_00360 [Desulfallas thermosapovorans DSM 6562]
MMVNKYEIYQTATVIGLHEAIHLIYQIEVPVNIVIDSTCTFIVYC